MASGLLTRIIAGAAMALGLLSAYLFFGGPGLVYGTLLVSVLSVREFHRMVFSEREGRLSGFLFWGVAMAMLCGHALFKDWSAPILTSFIALFLSLSIIFNRESLTNESLLKFATLGVFGLFYCVWCPIFAMDLLSLDRGALWFLYLMIVVFFGDTFAYFGGLLLGKHKLNPSVSPKKTIEGGAAGICGSLLASLSFALYFYPESSLLPFVSFGVACGVVGQTGDLLISLIKRVHHVKDSGRMIPGHGGVLDRVDGILIACPLVYTFALLMH